MKIYLNPDGTWKVESEIEGIEKYEDLPEVVKRILHLAVVMLPYGGEYLASEEEEAARNIREVAGIDLGVDGFLTFFTYETYGIQPHHVYYIHIDDNITKRYKEKEYEPT